MSYRILVIEDDDVHRESVHRALGAEFECYDAATGEEALALLDREEFSCVLLDFRLPDYTGLELLPALVRRQLPVVMLTAAGNEETAVQAMKIGCKDYLVKDRLSHDILTRAVMHAIERVELERQLIRTEQRLAHALASANVGIWDWDLSSNEIYLSPELTAQLGDGSDETLKSLEEWQKALHPEDSEAALERIHQHIDGMTNDYEATYRMRHRDGSYRWILSQGRIERDARGRALRMLGVHVDITERKRQDEALELSMQELQQFSYAAAHDLQEPLRSISGFAQLLRRRAAGQLDQTSQDWIGRILKASKRLRALIQDLQIYTDLRSEERPHERLDMNEVLNESLAALRGQIEAKGARVQSAGLPQVSGDPVQLAQLLRNLIGNAVRYCDDKQPCIEISSELHDGAWLFSVKDNGVGIARQHHERIFGVFTRLQGKSDQGGTGIGLAVCRRIVDRHGGRIWVESSPGEGSVFYFTLATQQEAGHEQYRSAPAA